MYLKKYRLKFDRFGHAAGTIVYDCKGHDYGCANDDTRFTGIEHISVTTNEDGDYPFFTVSRNYLESINES